MLQRKSRRVQGISRSNVRCWRSRGRDACSAKAGGSQEVREKILALLAEKTGYPAEMLDTGLDLEADLGIDTVKQAEFISEVREAFDIPRIEGLKIADFPTIEHIINFVLQHVGGFGQDVASQEVSAAAETGRYGGPRSGPGKDPVSAFGKNGLSCGHAGYRPRSGSRPGH